MSDASQPAPGDILRKWLPLLIGGGMAAGSSAGLFPEEVTALIEKWGVASIFFLLFVYYVPRDSLPRFLDSQQSQAVAMQKVGDQLQVMTSQAGKLDDIVAKLEDIKFNGDVFGDRLTRIEERLIDAQRQDNL